MKKNFIWNIVGTLCYSFTSLFFLIIVTRINGVEEAGVFTFAFSLSSLINVIGTYAGRTYQVTDNHDITDTDYIIQKIVACILMFVCAITYVFIKDYSFYKVMVILLLVGYRMLESYSEALYGIIQKNGKLYQVGISMALKGILGIVIFLVIDIFTKNIIYSIIGLILITFIIILLLDIRNRNKFYHVSKINFQHVKLIFKCGFFTFVFTILTQYLINAPRYAIDDIMKEEFQTIFGIIIMPATLMILCSQFLVQPFLVTLNEKIKNGNLKEFSKMIRLICFAMVGLGFLAEVVAYFIGIPFLELIYGIDLNLYLNSLLIVILGALCYGISYIMSTALIIFRKTFIQAVIYGVISLIAFFLAEQLVLEMGVFGAVLSYFISMLLLLICYIIVYNIFIRKERKNYG